MSVEIRINSKALIDDIGEKISKDKELVTTNQYEAVKKAFQDYKKTFNPIRLFFERFVNLLGFSTETGRVTQLFNKIIRTEQNQNLLSERYAKINKKFPLSEDRAVALREFSLELLKSGDIDNAIEVTSKMYCHEDFPIPFIRERVAHIEGQTKSDILDVLLNKKDFDKAIEVARKMYNVIYDSTKRTTLYQEEALQKIFKELVKKKHFDKAYAVAIEMRYKPYRDKSFRIIEATYTTKQMHSEAEKVREKRKKMKNTLNI